MSLTIILAVLFVTFDMACSVLAPPVYVGSVDFQNLLSNAENEPSNQLDEQFSGVIGDEQFSGVIGGDIFIPGPIGGGTPTEFPDSAQAILDRFTDFQSTPAATNFPEFGDLFSALQGSRKGSMETAAEDKLLKDDLLDILSEH